MQIRFFTEFENALVKLYTFFFFFYELEEVRVTRAVVKLVTIFGSRKNFVWIYLVTVGCYL